MTDKLAAFSATYSDWKVIRGRKIVQIVIEVPIEQADIAYQVLGGMPNPGAEIWVAIARLHPPGVVAAPSTPAPAPEPIPQIAPARATLTRDAVPPRATTLITRAAILCDDKLFQAWLRRVWGAREVVDKETAAVAMRRLLCIESRKEIVPGSEAAERYNSMVGAFEAWAHPDIIDETPEIRSLS